jgi:hypothetical protein
LWTVHANDADLARHAPSWSSQPPRPVAPHPPATRSVGEEDQRHRHSTQALHNDAPSTASAEKSARDVGVAALLCLRKRPGARADRGGAGRGHGGGRQGARRPPGRTMTSPYYAEAFHPVLGRCLRFVGADGVGGHPVHCAEPPTWRGTFVAANDRRYLVDACAGHRGSLREARRLPPGLPEGHGRSR